MNSYVPLQWKYADGVYLRNQKVKHLNATGIMQTLFGSAGAIVGK